MKLWFVYGAEPYDDTKYAAKYFLNQEKAMEYLAELTEASDYQWFDCDEIETED